MSGARVLGVEERKQLLAVLDQFGVPVRQNISDARVLALVARLRRNLEVEVTGARLRLDAFARAVAAVRS